MLINDFKIINFKSYRATTPIRLSAGFNVFTGKNNGGKTALLQALSLSTLVDKPHRHSGIPRSQLVPAKSVVELTVTLTSDDLRQAFFDARELHIAFSEGIEPMDCFLEFLKASRSFNLSVVSGPSFGVSSPPAYSTLFGSEKNRSATFRANDQLSNFQLIDIAANTNDNLHFVVGRFVSQTTYSFQAQRPSLASCKFGDSAILKPNAENLPEVLSKLQGRQPERFDQFNIFVNRVFPSIRRISVHPNGDNLEILVWSTDTPVDRADLAIELEESGTGIGQALAMLYIIVTSESPRTIIIDEPSIFLHPGAMIELIRIMQAGPVRHQYVIATHSPEIIRATQAERVYSVDRQDEQSYIRPVISGDIISFRRLLSEVGARLYDLFGADNILWVEGATEAECFPRINQARSVTIPPGLAIIALEATGDFEGRRARAVAIWEIYNRLSTAGNLIPVTVAISLDREGRSDTDIEKAEEMSNGLIRFLPRRCFENYLIHAPAITAVLNTLPSFSEASVVQQDVEAWLRTVGGDTKYDPGRTWNGDARNIQWIISVKGALLLHDLFQTLSQAKEEYHKVEHGAALTDWICGHDPEHFADLADYLQCLMR